MIKNCWAPLAMVALIATSQAQLRMSETCVNPPGSPDVGREYVEIRSSQPNYDLTNVWVIGIDGEGEFNPGNIHWAVPLRDDNGNWLSTGSNGLFLLRDSAVMLLPEASPDTTVLVANDGFTLAGMGNDSYTVAIVCNFTGQVGDDVDTNDDGVIDNPLWDRAFDAIGWLDGDNTMPGVTDRVYATALNGIEVPESARQRADGSIWEPDGLYWFGGDNWIACDTGRASGAGDFGPYSFNATNRVVNGTLPIGAAPNPGNDNLGMKAPVAGDVNFDGCVDDVDLAIVLESFGMSGCKLPADFNGDGVVDDSDLALTLANFGAGC
ncbi:MAG: hypothetical protein HUU60_06085 [Armatimonadetes bacterium]|nr:hypothetical protein [Armatimonadota bacterium]